MSSLGIRRDGDGDHDALSHAATELVRIATNAPLRIGNADRAQEFDGAAIGHLALQTPNGG